MRSSYICSSSIAFINTLNRLFLGVKNNVNINKFRSISYMMSDSQKLIYLKSSHTFYPNALLHTSRFSCSSENGSGNARRNEDINIFNPNFLRSTNLEVLSSRTISISKDVMDVRNRISSLKTKKRVQKKRNIVVDHAEEKYKISAVGTADEYDLEALSEAFLKQGLYTETPISKKNKANNQSMEEVPKSSDKDILDSSEVLHLTAAYQVSPEPREMYLFREGAIVFWNISLIERQNALRFIKEFQIGNYSEEIITNESEMLSYAYIEGNTKLKSTLNRVLINENGDVELEKFTVSNVLAMSVKLGLWEASLDHYIENIEYVTEELRKTGKVVLNQESVLQHMGQLFALRHLINLSSDLLDTPDFYWEHERLEQIYNRVSTHLSIQKRTTIYFFPLAVLFSTSWGDRPVECSPFILTSILGLHRLIGDE